MVENFARGVLDPLTIYNILQKSKQISRDDLSGRSNKLQEDVNSYVATRKIGWPDFGSRDIAFFCERFLLAAKINANSAKPDIGLYSFLEKRILGLTNNDTLYVTGIVAEALFAWSFSGISDRCGVKYRIYRTSPEVDEQGIDFLVVRERGIVHTVLLVDVKSGGNTANVSTKLNKRGIEEIYVPVRSRKKLRRSDTGEVGLHLDYQTMFSQEKKLVDDMAHSFQGLFDSAENTRGTSTMYSEVMDSEAFMRLRLSMALSTVGDN